MIKVILIFIILEFFFLIPSYFVYRKFLLKKTSIKNIKVYSFLATFLMPVIYTTLMFGLCYGIINPIIKSKKFNSKEWIENVHSRYRMVNDLKKTKLLEGKTKKEVIEIMGTGFKTDCWTKNTFCYVAYDPENYAPLDHYEFIIFFNENNKVERMEYQLI